MLDLHSLFDTAQKVLPAVIGNVSIKLHEEYLEINSYTIMLDDGHSFLLTTSVLVNATRDSPPDVDVVEIGWYSTEETVLIAVAFEIIKSRLQVEFEKLALEERYQDTE